MRASTRASERDRPRAERSRIDAGERKRTKERGRDEARRKHEQKSGISVTLNTIRHSVGVVKRLPTGSLSCTCFLSFREIARRTRSASLLSAPESILSRMVINDVENVRLRKSLATSGERSSLRNQTGRRLNIHAERSIPPLRLPQPTADSSPSLSVPAAVAPSPPAALRFPTVCSTRSSRLNPDVGT